MSGYDFNDAQRNDPELRAKVAKVLEARRQAIQEANILLKKVSALLAESQIVEDQSMYSDHAYDVRMTSFKLERNIAFMQKIGGETYVGNMAAGRMGDQIIKMGDKFPL